MWTGPDDWDHARYDYYLELDLKQFDPPKPPSCAEVCIFILASAAISILFLCLIYSAA